VASDIEQAKREICAIGQRIYQRGYSAANEGNISHRVGENQVLCTPTMHCKGFLEPDDICLVDLQGKQLAGQKKPSSEVLLHLEIMQARPDVQSVVHCHPPHATAFAIAREPIPQGVHPEAEVFLGNVAFAKYGTPGTKQFAETILPFVQQTNVVVLANHGTVSYDSTVERAYWWTEILDSYCRVLMLARQLGNVEYLSANQCRELIELKQQWGFSDARNEAPFREEDPRSNAPFRATWPDAAADSRAFPPPGDEPAESQPRVDLLDQASLESLVQTITRRVLAELAASRKQEQP